VKKIIFFCVFTQIYFQFHNNNDEIVRGFKFLEIVTSSSFFTAQERKFKNLAWKKAQFEGDEWKEKKTEVVEVI
jgi:hypothetical protein